MSKHVEIDKNDYSQSTFNLYSEILYEIFFFEFKKAI